MDEWAFLPSVNGLIEAGIAANTDPSLADADKLRVYVVSNETTLKKTAFHSAVWAWNRYVDITDGTVRRYYACSAYTAVMFRLVSRQDGDIAVLNDYPPIDLALKNTLKFTAEEMQRSLTTIISTKVNWWLTNHHTGQGVIQSYAKKVATSVFQLQPGSTEMERYTKYAHTVGHWCSTKIILSRAGIKGIVMGTTLSLFGDQTLTVSVDLALRLRSPPAGTHRHTVAVGAAKRLIMHYIAMYSTVIPDLMSIVSTYNQIMEDPASYHMGAAYLTGKDRADFDDNAACNVLGRLCTFVKYFATTSTLSDSPHMHYIENGAKKFKDHQYDDFDASFDELCKTIKQKGAIISAEVIKGISSAVQITPNGIPMNAPMLSELRNSLGFKFDTRTEPPSRASSVEDLGASLGSADNNTVANVSELQPNELTQRIMNPPRSQIFGKSPFGSAGRGHPFK